jgi:hypothetical protein
LLIHLILVGKKTLTVCVFESKEGSVKASD